MSNASNYFKQENAKSDKRWVFRDTYESWSENAREFVNVPEKLTDPLQKDTWSIFQEQTWELVTYLQSHTRADPAPFQAVLAYLRNPPDVGRVRAELERCHFILERLEIYEPGYREFGGLMLGPVELTAVEQAIIDCLVKMQRSMSAKEIHNWMVEQGHDVKLNTVTQVLPPLHRHGFLSQDDKGYGLYDWVVI